jgi:hypothetical protein
VTALQTDMLRLRLEKMRDVPLLRSRGADVQSPVARAAFKRRLMSDRSDYHEMETRSLDLLLAGQVDVNHRSQSGDTALVTAVELGLAKHARKLLASGADPRVQDAQGCTVLRIAGENGFVDIVELLADDCPDLVASAGVRTFCSVEVRPQPYPRCLDMSWAVGGGADHGHPPRFLRGAGDAVRSRPERALRHRETGGKSRLLLAVRSAVVTCVELVVARCMLAPLGSRVRRHDLGRVPA